MPIFLYIILFAIFCNINSSFLFTQNQKSEIKLLINQIDNNNYSRNNNQLAIYLDTILQNIDNKELLNKKYSKYSQNNYSQSNYPKDNDTCPCSCNVSNIGFLDGHGYGRYCGLDYTCGNDTRPGCDDVDECCRLHDICVGDTGYCKSCECNIHLVKCLDKINNYQSSCGAPIEKLAKSDIINDICYVLKYAPITCGGCTSNYTIPSECL